MDKFKLVQQENDWGIAKTRRSQAQFIILLVHGVVFEVSPSERVE